MIALKKSADDEKLHHAIVEYNRENCIPGFCEKYPDVAIHIVNGNHEGNKMRR